MYCYGTNNDSIEHAIQKNDPISCLYLSNTKTFMVKLKAKQEYKKLIPSKTIIKYEEMTYFQWNVLNERCSFNPQLKREFTYVLLLPIRCNDEDKQGFYTGIDHEHKELLCDLTFGIPIITNIITGNYPDDNYDDEFIHNI